MPGMKVVQHWPFFASPCWMDEPLSCFPIPHLQTGSLPVEFLISAFSAVHCAVPNQCSRACAPPWLPTSQCFNPSSPAAFLICGSVTHRVCKPDKLNSPTKRSGPKAAESGNPVWRLCARTSGEAAPLGQVTASCRVLQTKAKVVPHAKKTHW